MRINHNINSMITTNASRIQHDGLKVSLEKLSTGLRINRASDDAAGLSVSEQMRTQIRGLKQAQANATDGIALLQIAEGAANEISAIMQRMRELAVQSSNDTLTTTERGYTNTEFQALMTEIERITLATQYNGMTLIDGGENSFGVVGGAASIIHIGANNNNNNADGTIDTMKITIDAMTLGALGLQLEADGPGSTNLTNQSNAFNAMEVIDAAIQSVNNMRADLGAYINRLDAAINNIANQAYNTQDAESRIRDVDFADESTQFSKSQIMTQASMSMLAQANAVPGMVLQLLG
jgi:flagellin